MAKWSGKIGFALSVEDPDAPSVWKLEVIEKPYYGEILTNKQRIQSSQDSTIDDVVFTNEISVLANAFLMENYTRMLYITYMGVRLKIYGAELKYPRVTLTTGGKYDGTDN